MRTRPTFSQRAVQELEVPELQPSVHSSQGLLEFFTIA
jgi:hypothetical protein